ncbi:beta-galactosidase-1-like protein 2 [Onthophagus taurus]|uniref:beta-galactosidase-1-like protein 2 n=1 Tax=Onthophagus taurus TaxID=166361 RepID=UPI0039BE5310
MSLTNILPSLYEYYAGAGAITSGLNIDKPYFTLNGKNITILSGAFHYFRVPKEYWSDRLRKMRASGLNTVETYVPWNLHEPEEGVFDFGAGGSDFQEFLDIQKFLELAKEEDLFAIVRPGPYICSEWEFGGLPSWLLRYKGLKVRTSEQTFMQKVTNYFNVLIPILAMLQFTKGGPIIAVQVENEYGSTSEPGRFVPDKIYLEQLRRLLIRNGIEELLFTSDSPTAHGDEGTLPGVLFQTANFASNPEKEFEALLKLQGEKPLMATEFWTGWFDHWGELHHIRDNEDFYNILERILKYPASVNMYMFVGGTSFGFMNGANIADSSVDNEGYQPDTTSYDYDAPISESGDYTMKYVMVKELLTKYNKIKTRTPIVPAITIKFAYKNVFIDKQLTFNEILEQAPIKINSPKLMPMELLPQINNNSGQSYGYIVYRKENLDISSNTTLIIKGRVCDTVMVLINGFLVSKPLTLVSDLNSFGFWRWKDSRLHLGMQPFKSATLDLIVENWGRNNFGSLDQFIQYKGLWQGGVFLDDTELNDFKIIPLDFKKTFFSKLNYFHPPINPWLPAPSIYKATLKVQTRYDTFLDMSSWTKGFVVVNNFILGRYSSIGPQQTLFLPAPLLKEGKNTIMVFEQFFPADRLKFRTTPFYKTQNAEIGMVSIIMS